MTRSLDALAKRFLAIFLMATFALPALAVEGEEVRYVGGTVPSLKVDTIGRLDLTNPQDLRFITPRGVLAMPYSKIENYDYSQEFTHNLGKLTGDMISVVRHRKMRHFFRITFRDEQNVLQSVIFEVPKQMPASVTAALETRAEGTRRTQAAVPQSPASGPADPTFASPN